MGGGVLLKNDGEVFSDGKVFQSRTEDRTPVLNSVQTSGKTPQRSEGSKGGKQKGHSDQSVRSFCLYQPGFDGVKGHWIQVILKPLPLYSKGKNLK